MLNIAICDDDALHGRHTAAQISALDGFAAAKLSLFTSADNLIYAITEDNYAVDIAVLDIQMESMDGIEHKRNCARMSGNIPERAYRIRLKGI